MKLNKEKRKEKKAITVEQQVFSLLLFILKLLLQIQAQHRQSVIDSFILRQILDNCI